MNKKGRLLRKNIFFYKTNPSEKHSIKMEYHFMYMKNENIK